MTVLRQQYFDVHGTTLWVWHAHLLVTWRRRPISI